MRKTIALFLTLVIIVSLPGLNALATNDTNTQIIEKPEYEIVKLEEAPIEIDEDISTPLTEDSNLQRDKTPFSDQENQNYADNSFIQEETSFFEETKDSDTLTENGLLESIPFLDVMQRSAEVREGRSIEDFLNEELSAEKIEALEVKSSELYREDLPFWLESTALRGEGVAVTIFGEKEFLSSVRNVNIVVSVAGDSEKVFFSGVMSAKNPVIQIDGIIPETNYLITAKTSDSDDVTSYMGQFIVVEKDEYICQYSFVKEEYKSVASMEPTLLALEMRSILQKASSTKTISALAGSTYYEVEPNDTEETAMRVFDDDTIYGRTNYRYDDDWYKIKFSEEGNANFWVGNLPHDGYEMFLYNDNFRNIADGTHMQDQRQIYGIPVDGDRWYYIRIAPGTQYNSAISYYQFRVKNYPAYIDDIGDSFSSAHEIELSTQYRTTTTWGRINYEGDVDYFKFYAPTTGIYTFNTFENNTSIDSYACLYDRNYNLLEENDDGGRGSNFYISRRLQGGQYYYIAIRAYSSSQTGYYQFDLDKLSNDYDDYGDSFSSAAQANIGSMLGMIEHSGDEDYFKFRPTQSGKYEFYTSGSSLDTYGYLYDSGQYLLKQDDDSGGSGNFKVSYELNADEWYYIRVRAYSSSSTGSYTFVVNRVIEDDHGDSFGTATRVYIGTTGGVIDYGGDNDYFKFYPTQTGDYDIYTTSSMDTYGYLFNNGYSQLAYNDDGGDGNNFKITYHLNANTWYYIQVRAYSSSTTGSYSLNITAPDDHGNSFNAATRVYTGNTSGSIDYGGDNDYFKFYPTQTGVYDIYTNSSMDTYGQLYNSGYTEISYDDDGGDGRNFKISMVLTANNWYYVSVRAWSASATGTYTLVVAQAQAADDHPNDFNGSLATISTSGYINGNIETSYDVDCFTFTPVTTGSYVIYTEGTTDTYGRLYGSNKTTSLGLSYNEPQSNNFRLAKTLQGGITYYVSVAAEGAGTGAYRLTARKLSEPSDTLFVNQWNLLNRGNNGGTVGQDINVLPVWEYTKGAGVTVAVIDSGFDVEHNDIRDNISNTIPGYNFIYDNTNLLPSDHGGLAYVHGSHVAGIIAASENGGGIIGVAPEAEIVPLVVPEVPRPWTVEYPSYVVGSIRAIEYCEENGIEIVNGSYTLWQELDTESTFVELRETITNANMLFVFAAMNKETNLDSDSIRFRPQIWNTWNMINVAAIENDGFLANYSNYGLTRVHIAAPGGKEFNMLEHPYSEITGERILSLHPQDVFGVYHNELHGTSQAAPHVAGVAALLKSYYPNLSVTQLKNRLISANNVSYNSNLLNKVSSNGSLNAWYAFCNDSGTPRSAAANGPVAISENWDNALNPNEYAGNLEPNIKEYISGNMNRNFEEYQSEMRSDAKTKKSNALSETALTNEIFVNFAEGVDKAAILVEVTPEGVLLDEMMLTGSYMIQYSSVEDAVAAVNAFNARSDVRYAEPIYSTPATIS